MDLVTGGSGFLGTHFCKTIDCISPRYMDILTRPDKVFQRGNNIQRVYHLAADVGGIGYLKQQPYTIFQRNVLFFLRMIEYAQANPPGFKELIVAGSVCEYGEGMPMREDNLNLGIPVYDTRGYGWAKRAIYNAGEMFEAETGIRVLHIVYTNLYGPGDKSSHVVAELVRKFCDAKKRGEGVVEVWGNGEATRDLLYVSDASRMLKEASERYYGDAINLATGVETTIRELAFTIAWACDYTGKIKFGGGPVGEKRRDIDVTRMLSCDIRPEVELEEGIKKTVEWYQND